MTGRPTDPYPVRLPLPGRPTADAAADRGVTAADGSRRAPPAAAPPTLGDYEVVQPIGQGGMGFVLRGRSRDGRDVAIKVLTSPDGDPTRLERFERERRLLARLGEAEGIVPLLD